MADKITTVRKARIGSYVGRLADEDIVRLNRAVLVFLGIAGTTARQDSQSVAGRTAATILGCFPNS